VIFLNGNLFNGSCFLLYSPPPLAIIVSFCVEENIYRKWLLPLWRESEHFDRNKKPVVSGRGIRISLGLSVPFKAHAIVGNGTK
jgi:hypothetical protein